MNASIYDSVMVGIAEMYTKINRFPDTQTFLEAYYNLLQNEDYLLSTTDATSDEPVVEKRMNLAIKAFKIFK